MCQKERCYKSPLKSALGVCVLITCLNPAEEMWQLSEDENILFVREQLVWRKPGFSSSVLSLM